MILEYFVRCFIHFVFMHLSLPMCCTIVLSVKIESSHNIACTHTALTVKLCYLQNVVESIGSGDEIDVTCFNKIHIFVRKNIFAAFFSMWMYDEMSIIMTVVPFQITHNREIHKLPVTGHIKGILHTNTYAVFWTYDIYHVWCVSEATYMNVLMYPIVMQSHVLAEQGH